MDNITIKTTCPMCKKTSDVTVPAAGYRAWQNGTFIQVALPDVSPAVREQLKLGICPECWDQMFDL